MCRLLVDYFLQRISRRLHQPVGVVTKEALQTLIQYPWPGNVRELENVLTRAVVLSRGGVIREDQVVLGGGFADGSNSPEGSEAVLADPTSEGPMGDTLAAAEARHVQVILDRCGGNKRKTSRELGITRPRLDRMIEKHDLRIRRPDE